MAVYDAVRSVATNTMLVALLFTLARPKYRWRVMGIAMAVIVLLNFLLNAFFYMQDDYTTLAMIDILFFIVVGAATKPLFQESTVQWLFNCFTVMNLYAANTILSYYLCGFFPYPYYAIIVLRVLIFATLIIIFIKFLRPFYRQAAEHFGIYLIVAVGMFANFAWYFFMCNDVLQMLDQNLPQLLLLILLAVLVYMAIFLSLSKTLSETALREENQKIQSDRELTRQRLLLMDETLHQMSIVQHDHRHFNNTLLTLLQQKETEKAIELIQQQDKAFPQKPQNYCQNMSVNAAVCYYVAMASQEGIRCEINLDIPEKLSVDELSLTMAVSNLMENAITAIAELPEEQRELYFHVVHSGGLIFEMKNPYMGEIEFDQSGIPISAKEGHGRGSRSVANFVAKYHGELVYNVQDGLFRVRMLL